MCHIVIFDNMSSGVIKTSLYYYCVKKKLKYDMSLDFERKLFNESRGIMIFCYESLFFESR